MKSLHFISTKDAVSGNTSLKSKAMPAFCSAITIPAVWVGTSFKSKLLRSPTELQLIRWSWWNNTIVSCSVPGAGAYVSGAFWNATGLKDLEEEFSSAKIASLSWVFLRYQMVMSVSAGNLQSFTVNFIPLLSFLHFDQMCHLVTHTIHFEW